MIDLSRPVADDYKESYVNAQKLYVSYKEMTDDMYQYIRKNNITDQFTIDFASYLKAQRNYAKQVMNYWLFKWRCWDIECELPGYLVISKAYRDLEYPTQPDHPFLTTKYH
jgi:hypothetical protein